MTISTDSTAFAATTVLRRAHFVTTATTGERP
jgi:hypothetical protein